MSSLFHLLILCSCLACFRGNLSQGKKKNKKNRRNEFEREDKRERDQDKERKMQHKNWLKRRSIPPPPTSSS